MLDVQQVADGDHRPQLPSHTCRTTHLYAETVQMQSHMPELCTLLYGRLIYHTVLIDIPSDRPISYSRLTVWPAWYYAGAYPQHAADEKQLL